MTLRYGSNYRLLMLQPLLRKAEERVYERDDTGRFGSGSGASGGGSKEKPKKEKKPQTTGPQRTGMRALATGKDIDPALQQELVDQGFATVDAKGKATLTPKGQQAIEKPKGGGGGGGGAKAKPEKETPEAKDKAKAEAKEKATTEAATKAGVKPAELEGMRAAAEGGKASPEVVQSLTRAGLMEDTPDGPQLTAAGRSALSALERGDARGAVAARQGAKSKQRQTAARDKAKADKDKVKADKEKGKADLAAAREARDREMLKPFLRETKALRSKGLPYGFDPYSLSKRR